MFVIPYGIIVQWSPLKYKPTKQIKYSDYKFSPGALFLILKLPSKGLTKVNFTLFFFMHRIYHLTNFLMYQTFNF